MFNEETKMYEGCIYQIINLDSGKKYIGQTKQHLEARWKQHLEKRNKDIFHTELRRNPDNFDCNVLLRLESKHPKDLQRKLDKAERKYIKCMNTLYPNGYNISPGGVSTIPSISVDLYDYDGNYVATYDSMIEAGEKNNISSQSVMDCCHGRRKRTKSGIFRIHGEPFNQYETIHKDNNVGVRIYKYSLEGDILGVYNSITECTIDFNIDKATVRNLISKHLTKDYSYVLFREDESFDKTKIVYRNRGRCVEQYDLDGNLLNVYSCLKDAAKCNNTTSTSIGDVIRGRAKTLHGLVYKYR